MNLSKTLYPPQTEKSEEKKEQLYTPRDGEYEGQKGRMVGRFCDPSYDDIELEFSDGRRIWFNYRDVMRVDEES